MSKVRWGIIGPGSIANNFADALISCYSGELKGIASRSEERLKNFGNKYNINESFKFSNYDDLLNSEDIDAVYISTPHTFHADLTIKAAGKGKHILCEKPAAVNFKEGQRVIEAVQQAGVFYKEGFMYRCHPQIPGLIKLIKEKKIGKIQRIISSFGFDMGKTVPESRLFQKELAGGAILDVGLYPVSFSRMIAGLANGKNFINPKNVTGNAKIGQTGVDEISHGILEFENDIIAEVSTAIRENMINNAVIVGSEGKIELDQPWDPGKDGGPYHSTIKIMKNGKTESIDFKGSEHLFFFEAELSSQTIIKQNLQVPYPGMTWEDTLGNLKTLDQWRHAVGYSLAQD
jgi:predicted dehydrogenase